MNKREVIDRVAEKSGIAKSECEKVLTAFEEVFNDELTNSKGIGKAFDKVYKIMDFLNSKKNPHINSTKNG